MAEAVYQLSGVSKWFGQVIAINDLTFASSAPIVGLLGPNGAGKSTLIKVLTGQLRPSKGKLAVFGQEPFNNRRLMSRLGYCPEHDRFYEDLNPIQFVGLLNRLQGFKQEKAQSMAETALKWVGLSEKRDEPIKTLSHGMRQKLKVAQALAHGPEWLVLDEPLSGMDPSSRSAMIRLLKERAEQGVKVLVSSHVLHELEAMTSDILVLNKGRLLAQGQVSQIREMIDAHPHRIALTSPEPRELGRELLRHDDVVRVEVADDKIVVETRSPDTCYTRIGSLAAEDKFEVQSMISLDDNLEAVFRYLVK